MYKNRAIAIFVTGLLLLATACTVTTQAFDAASTPAPTDTRMQEPVVEPTIETIEELTIVSHGDEIGGYVELVDALRAVGVTADPAGELNQPFFSVSGQVITVDGEDVQIFEYTDAAAAQAEAALISPNAATVGTNMISWEAPPHFYTLDRFNVLYVGSDASIVELLNTVLGTPIAEGQALPAPPLDAAALLSAALAAADYDALEGLMGDPFTIGYWRSQGQVLTPAEAVEELRLNLLLNPAGVSFIRDRALFPDLGGIDPAAAFGPDVQILDLVHSQGWGTDGLGEAILTIAENADGSPFWHGIIYSFAGFAPLTEQPMAQQTLSFDAAVYRNKENGFELNYPAPWRLDEQLLGPRGSGAQFYVADEDPIFSAVVYLWDPKHDLDAWLDVRRQAWSGSGATLLSEEELAVAGGHRAVQVELQWSDVRSNSFFMEVGDRYLELSSLGDKETFTEIISTMRFVESDS